MANHEPLTDECTCPASITRGTLVKWAKDAEVPMHMRVTFLAYALADSLGHADIDGDLVHLAEADTVLAGNLADYAQWASMKAKDL